MLKLVRLVLAMLALSVTVTPAKAAELIDFRITFFGTEGTNGLTGVLTFTLPREFRTEDGNFEFGSTPYSLETIVTDPLGQAPAGVSTFSGLTRPSVSDFDLDGIRFLTFTITTDQFEITNNNAGLVNRGPTSSFNIGTFNSRNRFGSENIDSSGITTSIRSAVPEPGTWAMMLIGFGMSGCALRRRRQRRIAAFA